MVTASVLTAGFFEGSICIPTPCSNCWASKQISRAFPVRKPATRKTALHSSAYQNYSAVRAETVCLRTSNNDSHKTLRLKARSFTQSLQRELLKSGRRRSPLYCVGSSEDGKPEKGDGSNTTTTEAKETPKKDGVPDLTPRPLEPRPQQTEADIRRELMEKVILEPLSVTELLGPEKVDSDDVKLIREKLFGYTTYYVTGQEPYGDLGEGVLLVGNLRAQREEVFAKLQKGIRELFGDKYDLFMMEQPGATEEDPRGGPRVAFALLRKEASTPAPTTLWQYVIAVILFALTAGACLELGLAAQVSRLPPEVVAYFTSPNPDTLEPPDVDSLLPYVDAALPLAYGVLGVHVFHEIGHWLAAAQRGVKLGIPYMVPNITLGSFGSVTQFKSICGDRAVKFDVSVAGPVAAAGLSLAMLLVGLSLSAAPENAGGSDALVQVPALLFQGSLLMGGTARAVLGYEAMHSNMVSIHPLFIAGWCGLTTTAFNMLPVGCLDGGRAMQAAFGKGALQASSLITYLLLGLGVLGGNLSLPWGIYILILQRQPEKAALNDVTGVGLARQICYGVGLTLVVGSLLPMWAQIADEWGIGLSPVLF